MRITKIETLLLSRMHEVEQQWFTNKFRSIKADCVIVVVHTDEGITGVGEAAMFGPTRLIAEWVTWLAPAIVGKSPTDPAAVPHPNGRSFAHDCAVAGIDCALWDLKGQIAGKRVAELLSPAPLDKVRLYASSGCRYDWRIRPEQLIDEALGYIAQGYTAMKFRLGTEWSWDGINVDRFLGLVREVHQSVAGRMELMIDGNQRLTEAVALPIAKELDRLGFTWFEEPLPQTDVDGYARLNAAVDLPITGGEQYATLEQFRPYLEKQAYGIVQPDVGRCGITEGLRIAEMADRYGVHLCPHSWHNGLLATQHAHFVAALPDPHLLELCMIQGPLQWDILEQPPHIEQGHLTLPNGPGLGVTLAPNVQERFPYIEGYYAINIER